MTYIHRLPFCLLLLPLTLQAQSAVRSGQGQRSLNGKFLTDSIEIGRPFQYSLMCRHLASTDVLFPDTARHFAPFRVQKVAVFATQTMATGAEAISRDSAVYTLVSFETDSLQALRVPVRVIHEADCTARWTQPDTVFLRSKLPTFALTDSARALVAPKLATETDLAPLQQEFNYTALVIGIAAVSLFGAVLYGLFGKTITRRWKLYQLNRRHLRFLTEFNRLSRGINSFTASETANQAVVMWKLYLERLDAQPYTSLTTPELAERINDERIVNALREVDRMIYGGAFSSDSQPALRLLSEVATTIYHRSRDRVQMRPSTVNSTARYPAETSANS